MRIARNHTAHQKEDLSDEVFSSISSTLFSNISRIESDLKDNIKRYEQNSKKKRKFENYTSPELGSETEKKKLVDAMEDSFNPTEPEELKIDFPENKYSKIAEKTVSEIISHQNNSDYISNHNGLSENIQTDILEWLEKTYSTLEKEIKTVKNEKGEDEQKITWKSQEKLEVLKRNFIKDMEKNLIDRKNKWELKRIDELRKEFLEKLYAKIDNFIKLENLLMPFIKNLGRLWDLSEGTFETSGFEILDTYAKLLENDESLKELANLLGRQTRAQISYEKELRDKVVIKSSWQPKHAYKGEINGLRFSNDISSVLPSELSLMNNPAANKLFQLKFAQKQLLSYDYQRLEEEQEESKEKEETTVEKKEPKGPIIICVDTSGSMHGTPENIAKTITFALSKIAIEEERKCYLISFSTGIETLDLTDFSNNPIGKLVQFLRMSFYGGTDATPALEHSLEMLSKNDWKNADVLMISDFVMSSLNEDLVKSIESEKEKNTCFYSLVIGNSGNKSTIKCFNHNWIYDLNDSKASRHLAEQLFEIKNLNKNVVIKSKTS